MRVSTKVYMQAEEMLDPSFVTCKDDLVMKMVENFNTDEFHGIEDENVIKFLKWLNEEKDAISKDGLADFYDTDLWNIIGFEHDETGYVMLDHLEDNGWLVFNMSMDIDEEQMMEFMVENSNLTMGGSVPFIFDDEELPKVKLILDNIEWDVSEEDFESAYDNGDGEMADWIKDNDYTEEVGEWDEQDKIDKYKEYIADTCGDPDSNIVWYDEGNDLEIEIPAIPLDTAEKIAEMLSDGMDRMNFYWEHINDELYNRFGIRAVGFDVEAPEIEKDINSER